MRLRAGALGVIAGLGITLMTYAPAHAVAPGAPTFAALDSSVPGHLTATVTSPDAPHVWVRLGSSNPALDAATLVELDGDSGVMDIETWGYQGDTAMFVRACRSTPTGAECSEEVQAPNTFMPTDVAPTSATWSQDMTVGQAQAITTTVQDNGGGHLLATWVPTGSTPGVGGAPLNQNHATSLNPIDGNGAFHVRRCNRLNRRCVDYPALVSPNYNAITYLYLTWDPTPAISAMNPDTVAIVKTTQSLVGAEYDVQWNAAKEYQSTAVSGILPNTPLPPSGQIPIPIDGGQIVNDGLYGLSGTVHIRVPDYGEFTTQFGSYYSDAHKFVVDRASVVTSIKPQIGTIYPNIRHPDRPGSTRIDVVQADHNELTTLSIRSGNTVVRTMPQMSGTTPNVIWDGRDDAGNNVASGIYVVGATDAIGNVSAVTATVKVDARRRILKVYTRTVTARASLLESYVGRCSTLRKPSARGWSGSLGYYANTRCRTKTWNASAVSTVHGIRLPAAEKDLALTVKIYGGAAKSRPTSRAWFRYLKTYKNTWGGYHHQSAQLTTHESGVDEPRFYIFKDRTFIWGFYTYAGKRYDVAKFTVELRYYVMQ